MNNSDENNEISKFFNFRAVSPVPAPNASSPPQMSSRGRRICSFQTQNSRMQYNTLPLSVSLSKEWWVKDYFEHNIMKSRPSCDKLPIQPYADTLLCSAYVFFLIEKHVAGSRSSIAIINARGFSETDVDPLPQINSCRSPEQVRPFTDTNSPWTPKF
jgi:hypothetical protein